MVGAISPESAGIEHRGSQGIVALKRPDGKSVGIKRAGWSENIGIAARKRAGWVERRDTEGVASILDLNHRAPSAPWLG
jgi:hypothetical protein